MKVIARAKVNLTLRIVGVRDDGYHLLESVMQSLDLSDELTVEVAAVTQVRFGGLPVEFDGPDLVERAVRAFGQLSGVPIELDVGLVKKIPAMSGLGGGSADAAAALLACDELTGRRSSAHDLMKLASSIGADVPFCLQGGTAATKGVGDKVSAIAFPARSWWAIAIPPEGLSTAEVYRRFDEMGSPSGSLPDEEWEAFVHAARMGDLPALATLLHNDLEPAAFDLMPSLAGLKEMLVEQGALGAVMSGSGSAICGMCASEDSARRVAANMGSATCEVLVASSAERGAQILST